MLMRGAHGHQQESRPDLKSVKCNRLEQWYSVAPATQPNVISIMNGGKKANARILSQTCYLIIMSCFCVFFSSPSEIFLKLNIKNVKAIPEHLDHFNWNIQESWLLEQAIKNVLYFGLFNSTARFCSASQLDFRLLCSDGSFWGESHRSVCLSVNRRLMKRCHLRARALKFETASYSGSDSDSNSTLGALWPLEGPTRRNRDMWIVGVYTFKAA